MHPDPPAPWNPTSTTPTATTGSPTPQVQHSCSCNTAPLCRRHHRAKTHAGWTYTALERGTYVWTSPHGYQYLRDHHGTLDVSRDRHPHPPDPCTHPPDD